VIVPHESICCGRPLYDYGMLDRAQRYLQRLLDVLRPELVRGTPIVALEPSCLSVLKDEAHGLFPKDDNVARLREHAFLLADFLEVRGFDPPHLYRDAVLHGHCHHKSLFKLGGERKLLERIGVRAQAPETGCCGMAGSFGFEKDKYDVSQKIGERVLLPAVRAARRDTLIVADGFSCRTQIAQGTERKALHVAQVLKMALEGDHRGPAGNFPETRYCEQPQPPPIRRRTKIAMACVAAAFLVWLARRRWRS
jgi:Fe-S oxidoreductase